MSKASTRIREYNRNVMSTLKPGDLVEFPRGFMNGKLGVYSHWAVYIGNGRVIHFAASGSDFGEELNLDQAIETVKRGRKFGKNIVIREDDFLEVAGDSKAAMHNIMDPPNDFLYGLWYLSGYRTPYSGAEIVKRAKSKLGEGEYNLLTNNCEHFATWCRYGCKNSYQVKNWVSRLELILVNGIFNAVFQKIQ